MRSTQLTSLALLAIGSVLLAGCGGGNSGDGPEKVQADTITGTIDTAKVKKTLKIGVDNPYYLFQVDAMVAEDKGFFREYGIESVEVQVTDNPLPGLIGDSLDIIIYDTDGMMGAAKKSGTDVRFLGTYLGIEANILGCREGINTADDVKGKTITGGQFDSRNDYILQQLLRANGIDPDQDVNRVSTGGQSNQRLQAVLAGTVDCSTLQPRHKVLLEDAGGKFVLTDLRPLPQNGLGAMGKFVDDNPDTVAAFLAATLKARQVIRDVANKDYVLNLAKQNGFDIPAPYAAAYEFEMIENHTKDAGFGPADLDAFIKEQIDLEVLPAGTNWRDHTDLKALWTAQKNLGLPLNPDGAAVSQ